MKRKIASIVIVVLMITALMQVALVNSAVTNQTEPSGTINVDPSGTFTLNWSGDWTSTSGFAGVTLTIVFDEATFTYSGYTAFDSAMNPLTLDPTASHDPLNGMVQLTSVTIPWDVNTFYVEFTAPALPGGPYPFSGNSQMSADDFPALNEFSVTVNVVATYGVTLTPATSTVRVLTGSDPVHTITVQNDGNVADSFALSYAGAGSASYSSDPVVLGVGGSTDIDVTITGLPDGTTTGTLTATSAGDGSIGTCSLVSEVQAPGVSVMPLTSTVVGPKNQDIEHTFTVTNTGNYEDTFDISVTGGPGTVLPLTVGPLAPSTSDTFTLTVPNTGAVHVDVTDVEAASQADPAVTGTAEATSDFKDYSVSVTPVTSTLSIVSGGNAVHTFTVENTGGMPDTYDITRTGTGFLSKATVGPLDPAETDTFTLTYTSPGIGDYSDTVTATSQAQLAVSDTAAAETKVATYGVTLTPDPSALTILEGGDAVHTITIHNTGSHQDTFDLITTGGTLSTPSVILNADESTTFTLTYTTPAAGTYTATVTATSTLDPSTTKASDTLTANTNVNRYGVTVMCTTTPLTILSGQNAVHSFTIENTGNVQDTFDVAYVGDLSPALSQSTVTLAAGASTVVTLTYTAPAAGLGYSGTVTATSQGAPALGGVATDFAVAVTHVKTYGVTAYKQGTTKTLSEKVKVVGGTEVHTFTVTNTGNDVDTFDLALTGDDTLSAPSLTIAAGASQTFTVTHDTSAASIKSSTVTVTSQGYASAKTTVYAKTYACEAGKHVTDSSANAPGTFSLDATATVPFKLGVTVTGAIVVDFYQLPNNPRPTVSLQRQVKLIYGTFTVDDKTRVTSATGTIYYTDDMVKSNDIDESTMAVYYWNEASWVQATGLTKDAKNNFVTFTIANAHWLQRSYDYDFVLGANKVQIIILPPTPPTPLTVEQFKVLTVTAASEVIAKVTTSEAVTYIKAVTTENAAKIIEKVAAATAAKVVNGLDTATAKEIIEKMDVAKAASLIDESIKQGFTGQMAETLNQASEGTFAELLFSVQTGTGKSLIENMATQDLNAAAKRVEEAVKKKISELDPTTKAELEAKLKDTMEAVSVDKLVALFIEIANLPATPSTVAAVFEILDTAKTMEVVNAWVQTGDYESLANVYSYLTTETLSSIWTAMTATARTAVYPYLDTATLGNLPELTTFQVTVSVSPATVQTGQPVTVTATIKNTGTVTGDLHVVFKEGGVVKEDQIVTVAEGATKTATYTVTKTAAGTYAVDVNGVTGTFKVEAPPAPAAFRLSNLAVSPATIQAGQSVTVTVGVENTGGTSGTTTVQVKVDGTTVDSKSATLNPGQSTTVTFTVTSQVTGSHTVTVGDLTASYTVQTPPPPPEEFPWTLVIAVVVIVAAAAGYYLYTKRKAEA